LCFPKQNRDQLFADLWIPSPLTPCYWSRPASSFLTAVCHVPTLSKARAVTMSRNGNKHRLLLESNQRKIQLVVETGLLKRQMICLALTSNTLLNYQYCCLRHCVCPEWDNSWSYSVTSFEDGECNVNVASTTYSTCHVADLSCYTSGCVRLPAFY